MLGRDGRTRQRSPQALRGLYSVWGKPQNLSFCLCSPDAPHGPLTPLHLSHKPRPL